MTKDTPTYEELLARNAELEEENEELRSHAPDEENKKAAPHRDRILDAARKVVRDRGTNIQLKHITEESGVVANTVYKHFPGGASQVLRILCYEIARDAEAAMQEILPIEDGREAMMAWMTFHTAHFSRWGLFSADLMSPKRIPEELVDIAQPNELQRFFGHLVKRCKEQGHCRKDVTTREVVHAWWALLNHDRVTAELEDGRSLADVCELTMQIMVRSFYVPASCLLVRCLDPVSGVECVRYEGVVDDAYYLEFHAQLFAQENFKMDRGIADLRNANEVQITEGAIRQMCEWAKAAPQKFPEPAKLAVIATDGQPLELAQSYREIMNEGPVNVEVFDDMDQAREWLET